MYLGSVLINKITGKLDVCLSMYFLLSDVAIFAATNCLSLCFQVEGGSSGCNWDVNSDSCGKYQIKLPYWIDCGRPGECKYTM